MHIIIKAFIGLDGGNFGVILFNFTKIMVFMEEFIWNMGFDLIEII